MTPIKFLNEYGETIEVRRGENNAIEIRHSDIDAGNFWPYTEIATGKKPRDASVAALIAMLPANQAAINISGYVTVNGKASIITGAEAALIRDAIKKL